MRHIDKIFTSDTLSRHRSSILLAIDLSAVLLSSITAFWLDLGSDFLDSASQNSAEFILFIIATLCIYTVAIRITKIHRSLWTFISAQELLRIGWTVLIGSFFSFVILLVATSGHHVNAIRYSVLSASLTLFSMIAVRILYRAYRERQLLSKDSPVRKRALIIGADEPGYVLLKEIQRNPQMGSRIIGFVDSHRVNRIVSGLPVLGGYDDIQHLVEKYQIEQAYLAKLGLSRRERARIIETLRELKVQTKVMHFNEGYKKEDVVRSIQDVSVEDLLGRGQVKLDQSEVGSYISGKTILVTGAGGSIGGQLVREIIKFKPNQILMVDVNENGLYMLERELDFLKNKQEEYAYVDIVSLVVNIREKQSVDELFDTYNVSVVFHAAAHKHVPLMERRPKEAVKNNVFGTKNVIDSAIEHKVERFIMISTDKAVNPTNVMGASKRATELILQSLSKNGVTKLAAVRFGNVLGSNGSVIPIFQEQIRKGGPVTLTDRRITRYFMTIPEATQLVLQAGYYANGGDIFVLDMGKPANMLDLAEDLIKLSGLEPYKDIDIIEIGIRPGEKMYEELSLDAEKSTKTKNKLIFKNQHMDIDKNKLDIRLAQLQVMISDQASEAELKNTLFSIINDSSLYPEPNRTSRRVRIPKPRRLNKAMAKNKPKEIV